MNFFSSGTTRLFRGHILRDLHQIPPLLERARIRQVPEVPHVLILPGPPPTRTFPARTRQLAMRQVHRRPTNSPMATLHQKENPTVANHIRSNPARKCSEQRPCATQDTLTCRSTFKDLSYVALLLFL